MIQSKQKIQPKSHCTFLFNKYFLLFLIYFKTTFFCLGQIYTVANLNDAGMGSLRQAILDANGSPVPATINFFPTLTGSIIPMSPLPPLNNIGLTINASNTAGFISLTGTNIQSSNGLEIAANNITILGLEIAGFSMGNGIRVNNNITGFTIGNIGAKEGNVFGINGTNIFIGISAENGNITNNKIGTNNSGTLPAASNRGIFLNNGAKNITISGNLIAANSNVGIELNGTSTQSITITNNTIGSSALLGNGKGIFINGSQNNTIGGMAGQGNTITYNSPIGIEVTNGADNNTIMGNTITNNTTNGIEISNGAIRNRITENFIFCNTNLGISLNNGGNNDISAPTINTANTEIISGTGFNMGIVEIFKDNSSCTPKQGQTLIGTVTQSGTFWSLVKPAIVAGDIITATIRDMQGNTSPFSMPATVVPVANVGISTIPASAANVLQGTKNKILYQFRLTVSTTDTDFTGLIINTGGTYINTDISEFKLVFSTSAILTQADVDNPLEVLGSNALGNGERLSFNNFPPQTLNAGFAYFLTILVDISPTAFPMDRILILSPNLADIQFSLANSFFSNTPSNGGIQTILSSSTAGISGPSALGAVATSASAVKLDWKDNSSNETGFEIFRSETSVTSGFISIDTTDTNVTDYLDEGLSSNIEYHYKLRALTNTANSAFSNIASVRTFIGGPKSASNLDATTVSTSAIVLTWIDNSDDELGFNIYLIDSINVANQAIFIGSVGTDVSTFTHSGLASNTIYRYYVKAYNESGESRESNIAAAITVAVPLAPSNHAGIYSAANKQVSLNWQDNSNNEQVFVVEVSSVFSLGFFQFLAEVDSNTTTLKIDSTVALLAANTTYSFRVFAANDFGPSPSSNRVDVSIPIDSLVKKPKRPTNLEAESVTQEEIALRWRDNSSDEISFKIERSSAVAGPWVQVGEVLSGTTSFNDIDNLIPNELYYYRVTASNEGGNSLYSEIDSARAVCNITVLITSDIDEGIACDTKNVLLKLNSNTTEGVYRWRRNGINIPNAFLPVYNATQTGEYDCVVISGSCIKESEIKPVIITASFSVSIIQDDKLLLASFLGANSYQWYYNYQPIKGATEDFYEPIAGGSYYVVVSDGGCSATSDLFFYNMVTGLEKNNISDFIKIYPNPVDEEVNFKLETGILGEYQINLMDITGKSQRLIKGKKDDLLLEKTLNISNFAKGLYFLEVKLGKYTGYKKLMKF